MLPRTTRLRQFYRLPSLLEALLTGPARRYAPMAVGWGLMAGTAAVFLAERIPNFRRDLFCRLPLLGARWAEYRVPADDE